MSQPDTRSSDRTEALQRFINEVTALLKEKEAHYGHDGGFYETNVATDYTHALGEAKLKLFEFTKTYRRRDLIKVVAWVFLILEAEEGRTDGPR